MNNFIVTAKKEAEAYANQLLELTLRLKEMADRLRELSATTLKDKTINAKDEMESIFQESEIIKRRAVSLEPPVRIGITHVLY